jgi:hypothetical protein
MKIRKTIIATLMLVSTQTNAEVHVCTPCDAGTYAPAGAVSCTQCNVGTYSIGKGNTGCTACPTGTYQGATGQSGCATCSAGQYQDWTGQTGCKACPTGTYQGSTGQAGCIACPSGWYQGSTGQAGCASCPAGQYQDWTGQTGCKACPAGQYQPNGGQASCVGCAGTVYNNRQNCCTQYWNGSSCVAWVNCGANASRQSNNTCSCNSGYNYNGGSGVPAGTACVANCVQTGWVNTGTKACTADSSKGTKASKPYGSSGYCYCQQTRNGCGGANEQWVYRGFFYSNAGDSSDYGITYCFDHCSCK